MRAMREVEKIRIWYDKAGDYLDVHWVSGSYFTLTGNDQVMVLMDRAGNRCGFKVSAISKLAAKEVVDGALTPVDLPPAWTEKPAAATGQGPGL